MRVLGLKLKLKLFVLGSVKVGPSTKSFRYRAFSASAFAARSASVIRHKDQAPPRFVTVNAQIYLRMIFLSRLRGLPCHRKRGWEWARRYHSHRSRIEREIHAEFAVRNCRFLHEIRAGGDKHKLGQHLR